VSDSQPIHTNRDRARSFGAAADVYDRTRPTYPDALVELLVAGGTPSVLDVGCGTGLFGRRFAERGLAVLGVEPDELMADVARGHGLTVEVASFEEWEPKGRTFDLLVAGQSWHWVDPRLGAEKAAEAVAPGGSAALAWNHAVMPDELLAPLEAIYASYEGVAPVVLHRPEDRIGPDTAEECFPATGRFGPPRLDTIVWTRSYDRQTWLDQLLTHSDHALLDPAVRGQLLEEVGRVLDQHGGRFDMDYECHVTSFARLD
jgi:SAM-dependent methyltransferase